MVSRLIQHNLQTTPRHEMVLQDTLRIKTIVIRHYHNKYSRFVLMLTYIYIYMYIVQWILTNIGVSVLIFEALHF
jgi:hypothetical protein